MVPGPTKGFPLLLVACCCGAVPVAGQTAKDAAAIKKELATYGREIAATADPEARAGLFESMAALTADARLAAQAGLASALAAGLKDREPTVVERCVGLLARCADTDGGIREILRAWAALENAVRSLRQLLPVRLPIPPRPPALEGGFAGGQQARERAMRENKAAIDTYESRFRAWEAKLVSRTDERKKERERAASAVGPLVAFSRFAAKPSDPRLASGLCSAFRQLMAKDPAEAANLAPLVAQRAGREGVQEICQALADHQNIARRLRAGIADDQLRELAMSPPRFVLVDVTDPGGFDRLAKVLDDFRRIVELEKRWNEWDGIADTLDRRQDVRIVEDRPGMAFVFVLADVVKAELGGRDAGALPRDVGKVTVGKAWTDWFTANQDKLADAGSGAPDR